MSVRIRVTQKNDFESQAPTHMSATHAFSKIRRKFRKRIPRELDQELDIPRNSMIN